MKTKLLTGKLTTKQGLVIGAWYVNLLLAIVLWATTSASLLSSGLPPKQLHYERFSLHN